MLEGATFINNGVYKQCSNIAHHLFMKHCCTHAARNVAFTGPVIHVQGVPIKNNPLGKIHYISYCKRFFHQIYSFLEEHSGHISSKFRYYISYCLKITTIGT